MDTSLEDLHACLSASEAELAVYLIEKCFGQEICTEKKKTHVVFPMVFPRESCGFRDN
jgi:hypothetical protein